MDTKCENFQVGKKSVKLDLVVGDKKTTGRVNERLRYVMFRAPEERWSRHRLSLPAVLRSVGVDHVVDHDGFDAMEFVASSDPGPRNPGGPAASQTGRNEGRARPALRRPPIQPAWRTTQTQVVALGIPFTTLQRRRSGRISRKHYCSLHTQWHGLGSTTYSCR